MFRNHDEIHYPHLTICENMISINFTFATYFKDKTIEECREIIKNDIIEICGLIDNVILSSQTKITNPYHKIINIQAANKNDLYSILYGLCKKNSYKIKV